MRRPARRRFSAGKKKRGPLSSAPFPFRVEYRSGGSGDGDTRLLVVDSVEQVFRQFLRRFHLAVPAASAAVRLTRRIRQKLRNLQQAGAAERAAGILIRAAAAVG